MTTNTLENLDLLVKENGIELDKDRSKFSNYSKDIALMIGYLLGVWDEKLKDIPSKEAQYWEIKTKLNNDENAVVVRALNNIRSNLMLNFTYVSHTIRKTSDNYLPIDKIEMFEEDFQTLYRNEIYINDGSGDIYRYIDNTNKEITRHFDALNYLFPDWVAFKHIRNMFRMPTDIKSEVARFQENQNCYPYKRYFNWKYPEERGNILIHDQRILEIVYENDGCYFEHDDKVIDASERLKDTINDFLVRGNRIRIFVDGENCDPYKFASMLESLKDYDIERIERIVVFYDIKYSSSAWENLKDFSYGIEVESVGVERIKEGKSLVDHKIVKYVSKAVYSDGVDSVILASSDSDFWTLIDDEANYLIMVEHEKTSNEFKDLLKRKDVFYCYLDRFKAPSSNEFFQTVFKKELEKTISNEFTLCNSKELLNRVINACYTYISETEREKLYNQFIKKMKLVINENGDFQIVISK